MFCLPFEIYERTETNTYYYCACEPFLCEKYCNDPDHERLPNCYNCKIDGDCTRLDRHWEHCILYNCDVWSFRDNLSEIVGKLKKKRDINNIYHTLNKFFILLYCYWGFGQPDKEKCNQFYDYLNFSLPGLAICRST